MTLNILLQAAAILSSLVQTSGDAIPDFSHVGYHRGDKVIPDVAVTATLEAPADGSDATAMIQNALDTAEPGAVLLKAGTYYVSGHLNMNRSGMVLRGEGNSTVVVGRRYESHYDNKELNSKGLDNQQLSLLGNEKEGFILKSLVIIGENNKRSRNKGTAVVITDNRVPVGAFSFKVSDASAYKVGDRILLVRPATEEWIHDIKMDQLPEIPNYPGKVRQWTPSGYTLEFERTITGINKNTITVDNPVVMAMDRKYGDSHIVKCSTPRVSECGVENIKFVSEYNGSRDDEDHPWNAVYVMSAEDCWVRNVTCENFVHSLCHIATGGYRISVLNCTSLEPIGLVKGMRMYAYYISGGELCLVKDCTCDKDRHGFITGVKTAGPNVFTHCTATNARAGVGPHQRWAVGFLYDCIKVSGKGSYIEAQDASNVGSGHGWRGANFVFWNCEAPRIVAQQPWASAQNWFVGCVGEYVPATTKYYDTLVRPEAVISSPEEHVAIESLYDWQLSARKASKK